MSQERLDELHRLWELLLSKLAEKGTRLQQALRLVQFMRECREVMFWIADKVRGPGMKRFESVVEFSLRCIFGGDDVSFIFWHVR